MKKRNAILVGGLAISLLLSQTVLTVEAKSLEKHAIPKHATKQVNKVVDKNKDGIDDKWVMKYKLELSKGVAKTDNDKDGLTNLAEYQLDLSPVSQDTDKDKVLDSDEDYDKDGVSNIAESELGLNPKNADSDNDHIIDGKERIGKSKIVLSKQVKNVELVIHTKEKKVIKIQYKVDKNKEIIQIKDKAGTITKEMVTQFIQDIQTSPSFTKEDVLVKAQKDLSLTDNVKIQVNVGFINGHHLKGTIETKASEPKEQTESEDQVDNTESTNDVESKSDDQSQVDIEDKGKVDTESEDETDSNES